MCDCNKTTNISMGCCQPVLGPIENYYTKYTIDRKLEEIESAITSGCCITPEEVDEKIEDAIDEIQIPTNLSDLTNDMGFISSDALSGYATTEYVDNQISSVTSVFITGEELSSYTYDKATIDSKIASGGTFDPTQYYNKTATDELLSEKLDASAYTPVDLSNYYNKSEVDGIVTSAITDVEAEIPSLSGYATEQWVLDKHYITGVDLSDYATKAEIPTVPTSNTAFTNDAGYVTSDYVENAVSGKQDTLSAGTGIDITDNVISATGGGASYSAGRGIDIDSGNTISFTLPISGVSSSIIEGYSGNTASNYYSHAEGFFTKANGMYSHAEGSSTTASGNDSHAEGYQTLASSEASHAEGYNTSAKTKYSHSEGEKTITNGQSAHAEGNSTKANGAYSHAEGVYTTAEGYGSHAEGSFTQAKNYYEHACGNKNVSSSASTTFGHSGNTLFSVGNSDDVQNRHNAFEIRQNGDIYYTSGGTYDTTSPQIKLQDTLNSKVDNTTLNNYMLKSQIWCGDYTEWGQISGSTDPNVIYLIHN